MKAKREKDFLKKALRPYTLRIVLLSIMTVLQSVLQVGMALLMRFVIDAAISGDSGLWLWAALLVADLLLQVGCYVLLSWYANSTMDRLAATLRARLLRSAVYCGDSRLQEFHSGELLSRGMEDVHTICDGMVQAMPTLAGQVARLVAAFGAVMFISPPVAGVLLAAGGVVVAAVSGLRPVLRKKHRQVREAEERILSAMQEDLQQLELIQSIQVQEQTVKRFEERQKDGLAAKFRRRIWSVSSNGILSAASLLSTGVLLLWGAGRVAADVLSYGSLTSMLQLLSQFRGPVLNLSGVWARFAAVEVARERLTDLLAVPEQEGNFPVEQPRAVVFENVTFRYPGDDAAVVENFSLRLPLEGWISLSGISGRGKTTLFKLILGLYKPQIGRVYLETERGEVSCSAGTRHLFAYVPQDYALFSGTIRENLLLTAPDADRRQRQEALQAAAADFVSELARGEDAHVGENNTGLSKGQLQRIAIARAILMKRKVLLLDECTSALDAAAEKKVLQNLRKLSPAAILVTHRPESLEDVPGVTPVLMEE